MWSVSPAPTRPAIPRSAAPARCCWTASPSSPARWWPPCSGLPSTPRVWRREVPAVFPNVFDYVAASSVEEAIALLQQHGGEAKLLAGGHSLLPMMKLRLATPAVLIDVARIPGLAGV